MAIIDMLTRSVAQTPVVDFQEENSSVDNIVSLDVERLRATNTDAKQVMPDKCLALVMADCKAFEDVVGVYVTLIREGTDTFSTVNYRAGLSRTEEIAYRQMGVHEIIDDWKTGE